MAEHTWEIGSMYGLLRTEIVARPNDGPTKVIALVTTHKQEGVFRDEQRIVGCPEGMANLHKIAAAPELLRAACYALDSLDAIEVPQEWDCRELLRTAIAKATGAAPEKEPTDV